MPDARTILSATKYISTALTAGFGIMGLLVEYKNKRTKKITLWGRIAITGIIGSAIVSFVSQYQEAIIQARDAAESARKNETLVQDINRLRNPLKDVFLTYAVDFPSGAAPIQAFTQQLQAGLTQFLVNPPVGLSGDPNAIASVSAWDGPGRPRSVEFLPGSPLLPRDRNELMFTVLRVFGFEVRFYRHPEAMKSDKTAVPDLVWGAVMAPGVPVELLPTLELDLKNNVLTSGIFRVPISPAISRSSGPLSVPDLLGSEIRVGFLEVSLQPTTPWIKDYAAIIKGAKLSRLEISVGDQLFSLPSAAFKKIDAEHGSVYAYRLPPDQPGLDALRLR
jgi:hypothetical protein